MFCAASYAAALSGSAVVDVPGGGLGSVVVCMLAGAPETVEVDAAGWAEYPAYPGCGRLYDAEGYGCWPEECPS